MRYTRRFPLALPGDEPAPGIALTDTLRPCAGCNQQTGWVNRRLMTAACGSDCSARIALAAGAAGLVRCEPEPDPVGPALEDLYAPILAGP